MPRTRELILMPVNDFSDPLRASSAPLAQQSEAREGTEEQRAALRAAFAAAPMLDVTTALIEADEAHPTSIPPICSPAEFIQKTAIRFKRRSKETVAVDEAYAALYRRVSNSDCSACNGVGTAQGHSRRPCAQCGGRGKLAKTDGPGSPRVKHEALALLSALRALVAAKGGQWADVTRNVQSKGLLLQWCTYLEGVWGDTLNHALKIERRALENSAQHSRFGVIWLLGSIEIEVDWVVQIGEGVAALGAAGAYAGVNAAAGSVEGMAGTVRVGELGDQKFSTLTGGAAAAVRFGTNQARTPLRERSQATTRLGRAGALHERTMDTLRVAGPGFYVPTFPATQSVFASIASKPVNNFEDVLGLVVGGAIGTSVAVAQDLIYETLRTIGQNLWQAACAFLEKMRGIWARGETAKTVAPLVKMIAGQVVIHFCEAAAPFVGGAKRMGTGFAQIIRAAGDRIALWQDRQQFNVAEGHFSMIGDSIESQVSKGMLYGLSTMLQGAGDVAVNVFAPGAGALVSVLMTALEWGVKLLLRKLEHTRIVEFLKLARQTFQRETQLHTYNRQVRIPPGSLMVHPERFNTFFKEACNASVVLPMLTLNSGMCGSIWDQVQMVSPSGLISQASFDAGVRYFSRMKRLSGAYLRTSGFTFKGRVAGSQADSIVRHALHDHRDKTGYAGKLLDLAAT